MQVLWLIISALYFETSTFVLFLLSILKPLLLLKVLEAGKKGVYCRCWLSGTFPACDGTHAKHNDATGDNVGPLIVSAAKDE